MADVLNIAPAPGMPPLLFGPVADAAPVELVSDAFDAIAALGPPAWGIYKDGVPVVLCDTVMDLGYQKGYSISDYPVESGSYASYNKVEQPFEARVRFAAGGSLAAREALIGSIEAILGDLQLYDVVTPDRVYVSANLTRQEYKRTGAEGGASLLIIEVGVQEVRILSTGTMGNTADPASASATNSGTVQPQAPTPSQSVAAGTASETVASNLATSVQNFTPSTTPANSGGIGSA